MFLRGFEVLGPGGGGGWVAPRPPSHQISNVVMVHAGWLKFDPHTLSTNLPPCAAFSHFGSILQRTHPTNRLHGRPASGVRCSVQLAGLEPGVRFFRWDHPGNVLCGRPASFRLPLSSALHLAIVHLTAMTSKSANPTSAARKDRLAAAQLAPISRPSGAHLPAVQPATKAQQKQWRRILLRDMETSGGTWAGLITSPEPSAAAALADHIGRVFASNPGLPPPIQQPDYVSWALAVATGNGNPAAPTAPHVVVQAVGIRKRDASHRRQGWRRLAAAIHLYKTPAQLGAFSATLAILWADPLPPKAPYPPRGEWIAESPATYRSWDRYFDNAPRPDKRKQRQPIHLLDDNKIQLSIPAELSCLLMDRKTGDLFCAIIRNFCPNPAILGWARRGISEAVSERKSSRVSPCAAPVLPPAYFTFRSSRILAPTCRSDSPPARAAHPCSDGLATSY